MHSLQLTPGVMTPTLTNILTSSTHTGARLSNIFSCWSCYSATIQGLTLQISRGFLFTWQSVRYYKRILPQHWYWPVTPCVSSPLQEEPRRTLCNEKWDAKMLSQGIIKPSHSPWGAPCILVRKPPEKGIPQPPRFVVDYRGLNAVTPGDGYSIPSVSNILDTLSGGKVFGKLDLANGYWHVLMNPKHTHKTAFATHVGLHEFLRMPYGLKTTPPPPRPPQTHTHFLKNLKQCFCQFLLSVAYYLYWWLHNLVVKSLRSLKPIRKSFWTCS